ncbi:unnamed protein product [marine sediment metagenome]|jgi:mRNA interferase MazF|uniref:PemK-like protein n=1 Tax=marine sediment metagenome TaxID=412755 RepID=X0T5C3_9ZZZZ
MALKYHVPAGTVVLCEFNTGFRPPEMVKRRPAIVVSHRLAFRDRLCTVVPLGQSGPERDVVYQCQISLDRELPPPFAYKTFWAKADMFATVSLDRLDLFHTVRDHTGRRRYLQPKLNAKDLKQVRTCILHALGMEDLTVHLR